MMTASGKWKVAGYLVAIFAAGMVSGWVVAGREAKQRPHTPRPPGPGPGFRWNPTNSSIYQLALTPEQKSKADEIISRYWKKMEARRADQMNDMRKDSSNRMVELSAVLTPEQRESWEKIRKDRDASWRSGTNSGRGGSNVFRGSPSGERGERGERGPRRSGIRDKRAQDNTNSDNGRGVTNEPGPQSPTPSAPPP